MTFGLTRNKILFKHLKRNSFWYHDKKRIEQFRRKIISRPSNEIHTRDWEEFFLAKLRVRQLVIKAIFIYTKEVFRLSLMWHAWNRRHDNIKFLFGIFCRVVCVLDFLIKSHYHMPQNNITETLFSVPPSGGSIFYF
jgi:hypothetical protein